MTDKRGRGRPRRADADAEILAATVELLREGGYRNFNVDAIAERTGIAKTTIYRRWPTKAALIAAAIAPVTPAANADAEAIVRETAAVFTLLGPLDGDALDLIRAIVEPRRALLMEAVRDEAAADAELGKIVMSVVLSPR